MSEQKIRVALTSGDPHGIGVETIIKAFRDVQMMELMTPVLYAHPDVIKAHRKAMGQDDFQYTTINSAAEIVPRKFNLINIWKDYKGPVELGKADKIAGTFAMKSLEAAVADLASNKIDVIVTAPINKDTIQSAGFQFPGHTEYLAHFANASDVLMFLVSDTMRVGIVTGHLPLKEVSQNITKEKILQKLKLMEESLLKDFAISRPKIAVMGLNPHAGDNGVLGNEEKEIIIPAIREAQEKHMLVYGPFGADGFFGNKSYLKYDAVLAMYHDQGLTPFKALAFEQGVNYTAGLPVVRTSPDHGTGYEIAGKNLADESSLRAAVFAACDIYKKRRQFREYGSNPLKKQDIKESREDKRE